MNLNQFHLAALRAAVKPFRLHWYSQLRSTNDRAAELRNAGELYAPAIVLASRQTAGRGRGSNSWWSGAGSLSATFVLPIHEHSQPHQIPLIAGLAVRSALVELSGSSAIQLKWPNDILLGEQKLAGLLCERLQKVDLIGVGINVNVDPADIPQNLRGRVATLLQTTAKPLDMNHVVSTLARCIHARLSRPNETSFATSLREYDEHHALLGRRVTVNVQPGDEPIAGICIGLDPIGRLLLRDRKTLHRVIAGHVSVR